MTWQERAASRCQAEHSGSQRKSGSWGWGILSWRIFHHERAGEWGCPVPSCSTVKIRNWTGGWRSSSPRSGGDLARWSTCERGLWEMWRVCGTLQSVDNLSTSRRRPVRACRWRRSCLSGYRSRAHLFPWKQHSLHFDKIEHLTIILSRLLLHDPTTHKCEFSKRGGGRHLRLITAEFCMPDIFTFSLTEVGKRDVLPSTGFLLSLTLLFTIFVRQLSH